MRRKISWSTVPSQHLKSNVPDQFIAHDNCREYSRQLGGLEMQQCSFAFKLTVQVAIATWAAVIGLTVHSRAEDASKLEPIQIGQPQAIELFPATFKLAGVRERVHFLVTAKYADGSMQDVTRVAQFASSDPATLSVESGLAVPHRDGTVEVLVTVGDKQTKGTIEVSRHGQPQPISFLYDMSPALSKQGCNSGACHGSPSGKGGFRLSLRAFDPQLDKLTLIHEDLGRRTNPMQPDQSLLILKPLMKVPHGGGLKMRKTDPAYAVFRDWIAEGCRLDPTEAPKCVRIEVNPPTGRLLKRPAHTQQLTVSAHFSDGSIRDITEMAVFTSSDEEVASVSTTGFVTGKDRGEAAIIVRYAEFIESCFLTFVRDVPGFVWNNPATHNYIDELVHAKLKQLQFLPSDACSDEEFVRRVYLDVIGLGPTIEETTAFLADKATDKRVKLIDALLERPEYPKFWTLKWGDLLRLTSKGVGGDGVYKFHRWVERAVASNMPYDQFARELLSSSGSTLENAPANFYRTTADFNDCVETVSQLFLGARLQCAKCHNHPFERWTQDNYYGMAAFFNRVQKKKTARSDEVFVWVARTGEVTQPRTGKQMKPWAPGAGDLANVSEEDRRIAFADWLTRPDNPFFAKIEVNRIWSNLLGRGIVDPIDDFRDSNPPSNAALLEALAKDFVAHKFDRKHVLRTILNSRTYQASYVPNDFNKTDTKYFSHYQPRLLSAEQLLDAICQTTGVPEQFGSLPAGTKATQLPAPDLIKHEFLKIFGQPERQTVCACERSNESNLSMAIQFFNGPLIYDKLRHDDNRFRQLVKASKTDPEIIAQLYLAGVNRLPTDKELQASLNHLAAKDTESTTKTAEINVQVAALNKQMADVQAVFATKLLDTKLQTVPEVLRADLKAALAIADAQRTPVQKYLIEKLGAAVAVKPEEITTALDDNAKKAIADAQAKLAEVEKVRVALGAPRMIALEDICWALLNTNEFLFQH